VASGKWFRCTVFGAAPKTGVEPIRPVNHRPKDLAVWAAVHWRPGARSRNGDRHQPKAQIVISEALKNRLQSVPEAVNSAYTAAMGPAPDVVKMVEGLKERARAAGRKEIQPALENAKPVDVSPVISAIDEKLRPGINALLNPKSQLPLSDFQQELARIKQQLTTGNGETLFDAQRLHRVQSDIGDQAYQLSKSPNPKDKVPIRRIEYWAVSYAISMKNSLIR